MIAPLPALTPSGEVTVVLQLAGLGTLVGAAPASRRRASDAEFETWLLTTRWTVAGAVAGLLLVVLVRVL